MQRFVPLIRASMVSRKQGNAAAAQSSATLSQGAPVTAASWNVPAQPGWPNPVPTQLAYLVGRVVQQSQHKSEVVAYWNKAVAKASDAKVAGLSTDTQLEAAYSAVRLAAMAILASYHIRVKSGGGHHELYFAAVAALGLPGCADLVPDSEEVRGMRHAAEYHAVSPPQADADHATAWVARTLPLLRTALINADTTLAVMLAPVPY